MLPFTRFEPEASVHTTEGGAIVLDLIDPDDAERLASGGDIAVHYTGYLLTGKKFDSSRTPERGPFRVQIPGQLIQGWNEGLIDIAVGGRRRLIIPPHLGYGPRAVGGGLIPANSTLVFDVEAMWIKNPTPAEPATEPKAPDQEEGRD
jgi:FKBP-type peptidyl-prolyl cis-trans isomerase